MLVCLRRGRGKEGQLGLGQRKDPVVRTPQRITSLAGQTIMRVSCGEMHSLALSASGEVFMWGLIPEARRTRNDDDAFDHASVGLTGLSQEAMSRSDLRENMNDIMARLVRDSELVYESTENDTGLGELDPTLLAELRQNKVQTIRSPVSVPRPCPSLSAYLITHIAAGFAHSLATSSCGALFSCGYNDKGQLGIGSRRNSAAFQRIKFLEDVFITEIACGQQHSLAVTRLAKDDPDAVDGTAGGCCYSWGLGILGQLGSGINISWLPMKVEIPQPVASISAGSHHSVAVTTDGNVYSWGHSEYGQHGAGERFDDLQRGSHYFFPRLQESLATEEVKVQSVACSSHSTFALTRDGRVYSWGWNAFGVLGNGKFQHSVRPQKLFGLKDNVALHVSAGSNHCGVVVKTRGCHYSLRYGHVLQNAEFSDVEFVVGQTRVRAHQVVVCARSAYLRGLLRVAAMALEQSDDVAPNADGKRVVVIEDFHDVDPLVFQAFLRYLYTERLEIASHKRKALAALAARVCLAPLVVECQDVWRKPRNQEGAGTAFVQDMHAMVLNPTLADVEFQWPVSSDKGEDQGFERVLAHKAILSQVDYFHTMFTGGFSEGLNHQATASAAAAGPNGIHTIELQYMQEDGVSLAAFKGLLLWIYTGAFDLLQDLEPSEMMDLYVGASLLGLTVLANLCERQLVSVLPQLDYESVAACLDFADRFDAQRLKTSSLQVMKRQQEVVG